jgi:hypothetical protein
MMRIIDLERRFVLVCVAFLAAAVFAFSFLRLTFTPEPVEAQPPPQTGSSSVSVEVLCFTDCPPEELPKTGPGPPETRAAVLVEGFGPPQALLYILKDGAVARTAGIPSSGIFSVELTGLSPGQTRIGVFAQDTDNLTTPTVSLTVVLYPGNITRIYDLLLPPTIRLEKDVVREGERVRIDGQTYPRASVRVMRSPDRQSQEVLADRRGRWEAIFTTDKLSGTYTVTARSFLGSGLLSEESETVSFTVIPLPGRQPLPPRKPGEAPPPRPEGAAPLCADTNGDRTVNLADFSIMLFNWGVPKDPRVDCNGDGVVNLIDLSILFYWWTG